MHDFFRWIFSKKKLIKAVFYKQFVVNMLKKTGDMLINTSYFSFFFVTRLSLQEKKPSLTTHPIMQNLTLTLGILLIILGARSYLGTGQESLTALIPSFFGILFLLFGWLGKKESLRKHMMHAAAGLALLGIFGTIGAVPGLIEVIRGGEVERPLAIISRSAMFVMCVGFLIRAVQSFIAARKKN